jgi:hypothetical protein
MGTHGSPDMSPLLLLHLMMVGRGIEVREERMKWAAERQAQKV